MGNFPPHNRYRVPVKCRPWWLGGHCWHYRGIQEGKDVVDVCKATGTPYDNNETYEVRDCCICDKRAYDIVEY